MSSRPAQKRRDRPPRGGTQSSENGVGSVRVKYRIVAPLRVPLIVGPTSTAQPPSGWTLRREAHDQPRNGVIPVYARLDVGISGATGATVSGHFIFDVAKRLGTGLDARHARQVTRTDQGEEPARFLPPAGRLPKTTIVFPRAVYGKEGDTLHWPAARVRNGAWEFFWAPTGIREDGARRDRTTTWWDTSRTLVALDGTTLLR